MTISTPSLPFDATPAGALPGIEAVLIAPSGANITPAGQPPADGGTDVPAGFAGWLPETEAPKQAVPGPANLEQAAAFATALLWTPAPQLMEATSPAGLGVQASPTPGPEMPAGSAKPAAGQEGKQAVASAYRSQPDGPMPLTPDTQPYFRGDSLRLQKESITGSLPAGTFPRPAVCPAPDVKIEAAIPLKVDEPQLANDTVMPSVEALATDKPARPLISVRGPGRADLPVPDATARGTDAPKLPVNVSVEPTLVVMPGEPSLVAGDNAVPQLVESAAGDAPALALPVSAAEEKPQPGFPSAASRRTTGHAAARREKIALPIRGSVQTTEPQAAPLGKIFLSASQQAGRARSEIVGTGVAHPAPSMSSAPVKPAHTAETLASLPLPDPTRNGFGPVTTVPQLDFSSLGTFEPAIQARDAVAAVMQVVDLQEQPAQGTSHVVNLCFDFGSDSLAVRVERHSDGTVQAKFHTDSPELRTALAHEWQQAAAAPENILRLATPEFHAAPRGDQPAGFTADSGQGAPRDQASGQAAAESASRPARADVRPSSPVNPTEAPRLRVLPTVLHLQAVA